ncbi:cupin 2 conserved barrel domain protein [Phlyctema vagabunda]|uniref:Cupin 2 conserved barrel domain protein n=1 Tax=Phlyctema vagabunda TaxID=108571 RepID=A0ABR4PGH7_9HELO
MSTVIIRNSRQQGKSTIKGGATFTGDVWIDMAHRDDSIAMANVTFTPCARTHWHTHHDGQVLRVTVGSGWICDRGGKPQRINVGDLIWSPPGTTHWHGADEDSYLSHLAIGIGKTEWLEAVTDEEYNSTKA